jgi:hypothetical protein
MVAAARRSPKSWNEFLEDFVDDQEIVTRFKIKSPGRCCTKRLRDSLCESNVVAGLHEQTGEDHVQNHQLARV